jgi:hypothetical protein
MRYELVREIINRCAGATRPEVSVSEVESENLDEYIKPYLADAHARCEKTRTDEGVLTYSIVSDAITQRLSFTPDD